MKRIRLTAALLSVLLLSASCAPKKSAALRPDAPSETGGVGRYTHSASSEEEDIEMDRTDYEPLGQPDDTAQTGEDPAGQEAKENTEIQLPVMGTESEPAQVEVKDWTSSAGIPADAGRTETPVQAQEQNEAPAQTSTASTVPEGSLSPFGSFSWWVEDGKYRYDVPAQNTSGMATIAEMYSFPTTRFEDANKPPDKDNWFPGQATYDESTGEVTYGWDRWESTKETMKKYGGIYRGDETRKVCYLTFDCGYEYGATAKILDALRDKQAPGAFMLTGPYVRTQYDLIKRMLDEGHIVGNHTNNHLDMTTLSVDEVIDEMRQVEKDYKAQFPDAPDMLYFRPPAGAVNEWLLRIEAKMGYRTVTWSYTYKDYDVYNQWDYYDALNILKEHLHPGCVYLLHAESSTNAEILPEFIDWIRAQGYVIEPICAIEA